MIVIDFGSLDQRLGKRQGRERLHHGRKADRHGEEAKILGHEQPREDDRGNEREQRHHRPAAQRPGEALYKPVSH